MFNLYDVGLILCDRLTDDLGGEGAAGDVLVVVFDQDVVVSGQSGQVTNAARSVLVVHTADLRFGRTLDGQVQTTWTDRRTHTWLQHADMLLPYVYNIVTFKR